MKTTQEQMKGKGGKKGGTQFPRFSLEHLSQYLNNLASKTHINSISIEQLNAGVFGVRAKSTTGQIKSSALKQFGLLDGPYKNLKATELCSKIAMAEDDEKTKLFQQAFHKVSVFGNAIKTFHNSKTEKSKIGQYAVSTLKVHPDMKDEFVKILIESAETSGLCTVDGNTVLFSDFNHMLTENEDINTNEDKVFENENNEKLEEKPEVTTSFTSTKKHGQASNINVTIDIDSSMDSEKLEKLLKLLKNYGAI